MEPGQTLKIDIKFILKNTRDFFRWLFKDNSYDDVPNTNDKKREKRIEWQRRVGLESVLKHIEEIKKYD